jgi:hypothetical protein
MVTELQNPPVTRLPGESIAPAGGRGHVRQLSQNRLLVSPLAIATSGVG